MTINERCPGTRGRNGRAASLGLLLALAFGMLSPVGPAHADGVRDREYWLRESGIEKAWEVSKGKGVKIAVIDSGVDAGHPDLKGVVVGGTDVSGAGADDGGKPIGAKPEHGTLVATMLAGRGHEKPQPSPSASGKKDEKDKNASPSASPSASEPAYKGPGNGPDGVVGVAPEAEVLAISTWLGSPNPAGVSDQDQIPEAVHWAVDQGAKVINISLGSSSTSWPQSWDTAFEYAEQKDVVIVAAAGNRVGGSVQVGAPATIPGVLTVAGLDRDGKASVDASSQGISIGVAAPAEDLVGGLPDDKYAEWAGTSGATPIVAGVAALIRSRWPEMSAHQVINRIVSTAKDTGDPGKDPLYGYGVLDAEAALTDDVSEATENPLGSISDWIRVHRKGGPSEVPSQQPSAEGPATPGELLPEAAAPIPVPPTGTGSPWPGFVVIGFSALLLVLLLGAALHLRRVARNPESVGDDGEN